MDRMMTMAGLALALLGCAASPVHAQAYKCKQANGTVSFQAQPCPAGSTGSTLSLPPPSSEPTTPASAPRPSWQDAARESDRRRVDDSIKARNDEIEANNRRVRCNQARQQLGVLKEARLVYRRDDKGERRYIDDKDRVGEVAAAQRRVATECG